MIAGTAAGTVALDDLTVWIADRMTELGDV
jgi:hypothetical protein